VEYLKLVEAFQPRESCQDVVQRLEAMLEDARAGKLIGIAGVRLYRDRHYVFGVCGETERCPTFTRGMLRALDDHLADLVVKQAEQPL
jgi:hypothetical protein